MGIQSRALPHHLKTAERHIDPPTITRPHDLTPSDVALLTLQCHPERQALLSLLLSKKDMHVLTNDLKVTWRQDLHIVKSDISTLQERV